MFYVCAGVRRIRVSRGGALALESVGRTKYYSVRKRKDH